MTFMFIRLLELLLININWLIDFLSNNQLTESQLTFQQYIKYYVEAFATTYYKLYSEISTEWVLSFYQTCYK